MKIAQVSPLFESVPPKAYGGTERVVSYLTEELVRQGHDVTLFASGDSETKARLISSVEQSVRDSALDHSWMGYHLIQMDVLAAMAEEFDIIHFHTDFLQFPTAKYFSTPHVTTLHGRLDLPYLVPLYRHFDSQHLVSISDSQREPLRWANWLATVHHGIPDDLYSFNPDPGDYFLFLGRISPEKRVDRAIEIALRCDRPIFIGAKLNKAEEPYFKEFIKPLLRHPLVTYVGEVGGKDKRELLENAAALLFPIDWPEPFGLVMIESFSCGTPVVAYGHGSVPEIVEDGVTGFIVSNQEEAVRAAMHIDSISRENCRAAFERRFTAPHMAANYLEAYRRLLAT
ncbi:glycosyltransferase family 4 protein [Noviherbaspirillum denitrificans]|uniref:Glycosyl transferase n=1 Tax=Noviherbaspirillum denitrificans TaxID=1968433 RepID=A0A254TQM7_9BURK|nr:glycosyltransferase family 4 protein [Noviherbaspirillum denitrificans]OWW22963.1 glycosyl transferase [Noviherbaspirillum denitrificans]